MQRPDGSTRRDTDKQPLQHQLHIFDSNRPDFQTYFDIDPPKRRNAGYRVRRNLRLEQQIEMPLFITAVELRAGVEADDRKWNQSFCKLREEISNEINSLRLVLSDKTKVELA